MRRQHVVVGVDDADVGRFLSHHFELVLVRQSGKRMGHIGAPHAIGAALTRLCFMQLRQIGLARAGTALTNPFGDGQNLRSDHV